MGQQGPVPLGATGESVSWPVPAPGNAHTPCRGPSSLWPLPPSAHDFSDAGPAASILQGPCDDTGPTQNPRSLTPSSSSLCKAPLSGSHVCTDRGIGTWTLWGIFIPPPH